MRACLDCSRLIPQGSRCPDCTKAFRSSRYGAPHQRARRDMAADLPARCAYCGEWIEQGEPFNAAHVVDGDSSAGWVVSHPLCNQRARQNR